MRVISGSARGKQLLAVPGDATRPTIDRVKESLFSAIQMRIMGATVLDLFAGTGQLGIEALSRGAKFADFVDNSKAARDVITKNITGARLTERSKVHAGDFSGFVSSAQKQKYDIIFLDPPYGGTLLENALNVIERFDILSINGIIICESASDDKWKTSFETLKQYKYGTVLITILKRA